MNNPRCLIILDYQRASVVITMSGEDPEQTFRDYCEQNGLSTENCHWMAWDGRLAIEP